MSEEKQAEETAKDEASSEEAAAPAKRKKRKLIIIALIALLVVGGGATAWFMMRPAEHKEEDVAEVPEEFVDVPAMQVSLRRSDGGVSVIKLHVMLVPGEKTAEELTPRLPMLIDRYQPFLRELRPEDLSGSAATYRIKEELLIRSNQALGEKSVRDVLIQDLMQA